MYIENVREGFGAAPGAAGGGSIYDVFGPFDEVGEPLGAISVIFEEPLMNGIPVLSTSPFD